MHYLGFDLGSKTLGISISDKTNTIASVLTTLRFEQDNYQELLEQLDKILPPYQPLKIVMGLPKNMNNTLGPRAQITLDFKKILEKRYSVQVIMEDERLTSVISNNVLIKADLSRKKRKQKVDSLAAVIILQGYLDRKR